MAESIQNINYVYIHYNKLTNQPFYVGRGFGDRFKHTFSRNRYWKNYVNKYGFYYEKIEENLTLEQSYYLEVYWISQLKAWGFKLTNLSSGGEFSRVGAKASIETRLKMSKTRMGLPSGKKGKSKYKSEEERLLADKLSKSKFVKSDKQKADNVIRTRLYYKRIRQEKLTMIF